MDGGREGGNGEGVTAGDQQEREGEFHVSIEIGSGTCRGGLISTRACQRFKAS